MKGVDMQRGMKTFVLSQIQEYEKLFSFPSMLDTQTIIVLFVLFLQTNSCISLSKFVSAIVRSQYTSAINDLNVVGGCEMLTLASLSTTATLI